MCNERERNMDNIFSGLEAQFHKWEISNRVSRSASDKIKELFAKIVMEAKFEFKDICVSYKPDRENGNRNLMIKELIVPSEFDVIADSGYERKFANTCIRNITICVKEKPEAKINIHFSHRFDVFIDFIADGAKGIKYEYNLPSGNMCLRTAVEISSTGIPPCIYKASYSFLESELTSLAFEGEKYYICCGNDDESLRYENSKDIATLRKKKLLPEFNRLIQSVGTKDGKSGRVLVSIDEKTSCVENVYVKYNDSEGAVKSAGMLTNVPIMKYTIGIKYQQKEFDTPMNIGEYNYQDLLYPDMDIEGIIASAKIYYEGDLWNI